MRSILLFIASFLNLIYFPTYINLARVIDALIYFIKIVCLLENVVELRVYDFNESLARGIKFEELQCSRFFREFAASRRVRKMQARDKPLSASVTWTSRCFTENIVSMTLLKCARYTLKRYNSRIEFVRVLKRNCSHIFSWENLK